MPEPYDLIIIGAGWFGLSAAKAYHQLHPTHSLLALESSSSIGGTWSSDRLYPGLKSNNILGSYEHPDFPMSEEVYGVKEGEHIPGTVMHQYLTDFAKEFGVFERTRFGSKVESVEPGADGGWKITLEGNEEVLESKKLIIASGLTSMPNLPRYEGQETFTVPFFHAKDFCRNREVVGTAKRVVVVGGAKSAFDVAYAFAMRDGNESVDLVMWEKGQGPVWLLPPYVTPLKRKAEELLHTRFFTWFSECPWGAEDGFGRIRKFFHSTAIGRFLASGFWTVLSNDVISLNGYDSHPLLKVLKPWNSAKWSGSGISINNYDTNFFDLVRSGKIRVHTTDIKSLSGNTVHLQSGESLKTDVVVCGTGWRKEPSFTLKVPGEHGIGLPFTPEEQALLNARADADILSAFPALKDQPPVKTHARTTEPLRLYRFIVPPTLVQERNLAFAGQVSSVSTAITAAVQGLWITAYLGGTLSRLAETEDEITKEVMLHTQWGRWRYPCGYGARLPDFAFDALPYVDLLVRDLGLECKRKGGLREVFAPYKPWDYKGLLEEWSEGCGGNS